MHQANMFQNLLLCQCKCKQSCQKLIGSTSVVQLQACVQSQI